MPSWDFLKLLMLKEEKNFFRIFLNDLNICNLKIKQIYIISKMKIIPFVIELDCQNFY